MTLLIYWSWPLPSWSHWNEVFTPSPESTSPRGCLATGFNEFSQPAEKALLILKDSLHPFLITWKKIKPSWIILCNLLPSLTRNLSHWTPLHGKIPLKANIGLLSAVKLNIIPWSFQKIQICFPMGHLGDEYRINYCPILLAQKTWKFV